MAKLKQLLSKNTSVFLLLLGVLMLAASLSSAADEIVITPTCDGISCANNQPCGSKCVCNGNANLCLDNT